MYREHLAPELKIPDKEEKAQLSDEELQFRIELLKERIYATITLLAVVISIKPHYHPVDSIIIIAGTAFSLWAANIIAANMSRKIILGKHKESKAETKRRFAVHAPLLGVAVLPVIFELCAVFNIISPTLAIILSIAGLFIFMITISYLSARALKAGLLTTIAAMGTEFILGVFIVAIKLYVKV